MTFTSDIPASQPPVQGSAGDPERCLLWLLDQLGLPVSAAALRALHAPDDQGWTIAAAQESLDALGVQGRWSRLDATQADHWPAAALVPLEAGGFVVITGPARAGVVFVHDGSTDAPSPWQVRDLVARAQARMLELQGAVSAGPAGAGAGGAAAQGRQGHWFWGPLLRSRRLYAQVALAALLTNVFALSASIFSMIVYDRVMPNGAMETLTALVAGVVLVMASDFAIRMLRGYFVDVAGARADMVIADTLFEQVVDMRMGERNQNVGQTASVLRDFESLREFLTSATLTTLIDLPFAVLFMAVIWFVGGPLAAVPLLAAPVVVGVSLAVQPRLRRLVQSAQDDGQTKHGVLVETLQGLETVKAIGAGALMRRRWQQAIARQAGVGLQTRLLAQLAGNTANLASQAVWIATVAWGVVLVRDGQIGSGAIVACSMLAGRTVAPLGQVAQLLTRLNQSLASYRALRQLMEVPREHRRNAAYIRRDRFEGAIEFDDVSFDYPGQRRGGLRQVSLRIAAGERVAILGRVGSGKTTFTRLLLGLHQPDTGAIRVDGVDVRQLDPSELRSNIGAVLQDVWLMSGSVKANIAVGGRSPDDAQILRAAQVSGAHDFIAPHPDGYGLMLRERGEGLSGGQRQSIAIARALVGDPPILLLDEPTSAMDVNSERQLIERLGEATRGKTLLVVTHRSSLLSLVDRVIVLDGGRIVAHGPKAQVLAPAAGARPKAAQEVGA